MGREAFALPCPTEPVCAKGAYALTGELKPHTRKGVTPVPLAAGLVFVGENPAAAGGEA